MSADPFTPLPTRPARAAPTPLPSWLPILPVPDDAPKPRIEHTRFGEPAPGHRWGYRDRNGKLLMIVCRFDLADGQRQFAPLTFCRSSDGKRAWRWQSLPSPRPLFGLHRLAERPVVPVLVVEGEKTTAQASQRFADFVVITSPGGARAAGKADWRPLSGRHVTIWPDADGPGLVYAQDVARLVMAAGAVSVAIVGTDGLPERWDLADALPAGMTDADLSARLDGAVPWSPETPPSAGPAPAAQPEPAQDDGVGALHRLAALPALDYDRVRESEAARLGCRVATLDAEVKRIRSTASAEDGAQGKALDLAVPEPWPEPVDGAALLDELVATFGKYVVLPDHAGVALALWVIHAHAFEASPITPRLAITSPEKRCGKTTVLRIVHALVPKPLMAGNITAAAMFRVIEAGRPTLLVDEADTFLSGNEDLRGVVNSGHGKDGSVIRVVGEDLEPRAFSTWAPVAIASIRELPGTIADRSLIVPMRRRRPSETVQRFPLHRTAALAPIARRCARWAQDHALRLADADPDVPDALNDRAADNWRPLLAIADRAGGTWPVAARTAALVLSGSSGDELDESSVRELLLSDIRTVFAERNVTRLWSADLCEVLARMEDRPWPEWKAGKPITPRQLARLLKPFGVQPKQIFEAGRNQNGYPLDSFADAFARYIPDRSPRTLEAKPAAALRPSASSRPEKPLEVRSARKPAEALPPRGLEDQEPPKGDGEGWQVAL